MMPSEHMVSCAVVIPTACRLAHVERAIRSIALQDVWPRRVIIADGSDGQEIRNALHRLRARVSLPITHLRCTQRGAASQRNEAAGLVNEDVILFMDDDVYMEPGCLACMLEVLAADKAREIGAVGVILTNQHYQPPGKWFRRWLDFLAGERQESYAGRVIGPAINLLPSPSADGRVVEVDWLNTACTVYRREAFEAERFGAEFFGYSLLEDVHLSLRVGRRWKLVVATAARAFHDSQAAPYKRPFAVARMEVRNRYLVMTEVLCRRGLQYHVKFLLVVLFGMFCRLRKIRKISDLSAFLLALAGCITGLLEIGCGRAGRRAAARRAASW